MHVPLDRGLPQLPTTKVQHDQLHKPLLIDAGYFQAPAAMYCPLSRQLQIPLLPPVTLVFGAIEGYNDMKVCLQYVGGIEGIWSAMPCFLLVWQPIHTIRWSALQIACFPVSSSIHLAKAGHQIWSCM